MTVRRGIAALLIAVAAFGFGCGSDEGSQQPTTPEPGGEGTAGTGETGTGETGDTGTGTTGTTDSPLSQGIDDALSQGGSGEVTQREIVPMTPSQAADFERGVRAFEQENNPDAARAAFEAVLAANPTAYRAAYNMGYLAERAGDTREAILSYQRALDIKPDYPTALRALFRLLARVGRAADGLAQVQSRAQAFPENLEVQVVLAEALIDAGRPGEGEAIARRMLQADANSLFAFQILLKAAIAQNQTALIDELVSRIERQLADEEGSSPVPFDDCAGGGAPEDRDACRLWAFCKYVRAQTAGSRGRRFAAHEYYQQVVEADPSFVEARVQVAAYFLDVGQVDQALAQLVAAKRLAPSWLPVLVGLGNAYRGKGQFDLAMAELREAARLYPTAPEVHIAVGLIYYDARTATFEGLDRAQSDQTAMENFRRAQQLMGADGADDDELTALIAAAQEDYDITTAPPPAPIEEPGGSGGDEWGSGGGDSGGGDDWGGGGGGDDWGGGGGDDWGGGGDSGGGTMDSGGW